MTFRTINPRLLRAAVQGKTGRQTPKSTNLTTALYGERICGMIEPEADEMAETLLDAIEIGGGLGDYHEIYGILGLDDMICILREIMPKTSEGIRKKIVLELVVHDL